MAEKEYIEREAAINAMCRLCSDTTRDKCRIADICNHVCRLEAIPAADVRPVVYCKECKHRPVKECGRIIAPKYADGYTDYKCPFLCDDPWYNRMPADDDYCSCGEKREES